MRSLGSASIQWVLDEAFTNRRRKLSIREAKSNEYSELAGEGNDQESVAGASDGSPIMSLSNRRHGISGGGLADSGEGYLEFWQAEMDLPEKQRDHQMVLTDGGFTVLPIPVLARQEIRRRTNYVGNVLG